MKTVVIGDIHGRNIWKIIIEREKPNRVIFIGDYFDSFNIERIFQIHNFKEIIQFKINNPHIEVILLIGNHDFHYFPEIGDRSISGFQGAIPSIQINHVINENRHHLQMAYMFDNILFTHAGVSEIWLTDNNWQGEPIDEYVNDVWKYKPLKFSFNGTEPYGDNVYQTPIWIRPRSLMKINRKNFRKKYIQVVGHTHVERIDIKGKATGGRYYFIDALTDKGGEYLIIENGVFTSVKV